MTSKMKFSLMLSLYLMISSCIADTRDRKPKPCQHIGNNSIHDLCAGCQYNDDISFSTMCK